MSRTFTIEAIYNNKGNKIRFEGGRYTSKTPSGAASKAFSQAYRHLKSKGKMSLKITMRETTQGSAHKSYKYRVSRIPQESEREINGEIIKYSYVTKVRSI
jgi:hypothetical protein